MLQANRVLYPLVFLLSAATIYQATSQQAGGGNKITLLALNQPPCSVPVRESVIKAKLAYQIAAQEQSEHGYEVSIKFQSTDPQRTFSTGPRGLGKVMLSTKNDTLTIRYPLEAVWNKPMLKRPITCYFYLHRNTGNGRSTVIAQTPAIVFRECQ